MVKEEKSDNTMVLISLVAIVAIVGLVSLFLRTGVGYVPTQSSTYSVDDSGNLAGDALHKRTIPTSPKKVSPVLDVVDLLNYTNSTNSTGGLFNDTSDYFNNTNKTVLTTDKYALSK